MAGRHRAPEPPRRREPGQHRQVIVNCATCQGSGEVASKDGKSMVKCGRCKGIGKMVKRP